MSGCPLYCDTALTSRERCVSRSPRRFDYFCRMPSSRTRSLIESPKTGGVLLVVPDSIRHGHPSQVLLQRLLLLVRHREGHTVRNEALISVFCSEVVVGRNSLLQRNPASVSTSFYFFSRVLSCSFVACFMAAFANVCVRQSKTIPAIVFSFLLSLSVLFWLVSFGCRRVFFPFFFFRLSSFSGLVRFVVFFCRGFRCFCCFNAFSCFSFVCVVPHKHHHRGGRYHPPTPPTTSPSIPHNLHNFTPPPLTNTTITTTITTAAANAPPRFLSPICAMPLSFAFGRTDPTPYVQSCGSS